MNTSIPEGTEQPLDSGEPQPLTMQQILCFTQKLSGSADVRLPVDRFPPEMLDAVECPLALPTKEIERMMHTQRLLYGAVTNPDENWNKTHGLSDADYRAVLEVLVNTWPDASCILRRDAPQKWLSRFHELFQEIAHMGDLPPKWLAMAEALVTLGSASVDSWEMLAIRLESATGRQLHSLRNGFSDLEGKSPLEHHTWRNATALLQMCARHNSKEGVLSDDERVRRASGFGAAMKSPAQNIQLHTYWNRYKKAQELAKQDSAPKEA